MQKNLLLDHEIPVSFEIHSQNPKKQTDTQIRYSCDSDITQES